MKKLLLGVLAALFFSFACSTCAMAGGSVVLKLRDVVPAKGIMTAQDASERIRQETETSVAAAGVDAQEIIPLPRLGMAIVKTSGKGSDEAAKLRGQPGVALADSSVVRKIHWTPNDPQLGSQWSVNGMGLPAAWNTTRGNSGMVVAVMDLGVDVGHPDLAGNVLVNSTEYNGTTGVDDDQNGYVDDIYGWNCNGNNGDVVPLAGRSHGTHVAGIIAAVANNGLNIAGVANGCKIMPIRVGDSLIYTDAVIMGCEYILERRAQGVDVRAVNMSFGGESPSGAEKTALQAVADAGVLLFASAGNESSCTDFLPVYPANFPIAQMVSVGGSTSAGKVWSGSNYGRVAVDLFAPGEGVLSLFNGTGTGAMSGTSMASPNALGVAMLLWGAHPEATWAQIKDLLLNDGLSSGEWELCRSGRHAHAAAGVLDGTLSDSSFFRIAGTMDQVNRFVRGFSGGEKVVLLGKGFGTAGGSVRLGSSSATVNAWTDTAITCTMPSTVSDGSGNAWGKGVSVTPSGGSELTMPVYTFATPDRSRVLSGYAGLLGWKCVSVGADVYGFAWDGTFLDYKTTTGALSTVAFSGGFAPGTTGIPMVAVGDKIYFMGTGAEDTRIFVFDTSTKQGAFTGYSLPADYGDSMPVEPFITSDGTHVYLAGGGISAIYEWTPAGNVWRKLGNMRAPRKGGAALVAGGKLLLIGGVAGDVYSGSCEVVDIATGAQLPQVAMPITTRAAGAFIYNRALIVTGVGGDDQGYGLILKADMANGIPGNWQIASARFGELRLGYSWFFKGSDGIHAVARLDSLTKDMTFDTLPAGAVEPPAITLTAPSANANLDNPLVTFSWDSSDSSCTYDVLVGMADDSMTAVATGLTAATYTGFLEGGKTYSWCVRAHLGGNTYDSATGHFSIDSPVTVVAPVNNTTIYDTSATLTWDCSLAGCTFKVYFGLDGGDLELLGQTGEASMATGALTCGNIYSWRVEAYDAQDRLAGQACGTFSVQEEPVEITPAGPASGTTVDPDSDSISWTCNGAGIVYDIYFGTNPANLALAEGGYAGTSYPISSLLSSPAAEGLATAATSTYYWRVEARQGTMVLAVSETSSFDVTTGSEEPVGGGGGGGGCNAAPSAAWFLTMLLPMAGLFGRKQ